MNKWCNGCKQTHLLSNFYPRKSVKSGNTLYSSRCKQCLQSGRREWYKSNSEKAIAYQQGLPKQQKRDYNRKHKIPKKYGISMEEYDTLKLQANRVCAICKCSTENLVLDHCHATGKLRGFVCNLCNRTMGLLQDNSVILRAAAEYIDQGGVLHL